MKQLLFTLILVLSIITSSSVFSTNDTNDSDDTNDSRPIDWKLLFAQIFANEIKKESKDLEEYKIVMEKHFLYNPLPFDEAEKTILGKTTQSYPSFLLRKKLWRNPSNMEGVMGLDFTRSIIDPDVLARKKINEFLNNIINNKDRKIAKDENFFQTNEGKNMVKALSYDGPNSNPQKVALAIVPGYAAHAIKFYIFEELLHAANADHGRAINRPLVKEDGIVFEPMPAQEYYGNNNDEDKLFDVIHPTGLEEMGNSIGPNKKNGEHLFKWLMNLPEKYKDTKFILMGYSKGSPVLTELIAKYPELRKRVIGFVSYAGTNQGTGIARQMLEQIEKIDKKKSLEEILDILKSQDVKKISELISCLSSDDYNLPAFQVAMVLDVLKKLVEDLGKEEGLDFDGLARQLKKLSEKPDFVEDAIMGAKDLSPYDRTKWNLLHFNNKNFDQPLFMFHLSALTDVERFAYPNGIPMGERKNPPPIVPFLIRKESAPSSTSDDNDLASSIRKVRPDIDWKNFSPDSSFLYLSSIDGFKIAPAGLFDTQVELAHTKSILIDSRPLSASLTAEELHKLWQDEDIQDFMKKNSPHITDEGTFSNIPRNMLIPKDKCDNITSMDLGEISGHHWSCMKQAFAPPESIAKEHFNWDFPRMAYMRSLLQVIALYNLYKKTGHN